MINISVNGESRTAAAHATVADVLRGEGVAVGDVAGKAGGTAGGIAVARNDRVVRRAEWATTEVAENDRIEIVTARQGG